VKTINTKIEEMRREIIADCDCCECRPVREAIELFEEMKRRVSEMLVDQPALLRKFEEIVG